MPKKKTKKKVKKSARKKTARKKVKKTARKKTARKKVKKAGRPSRYKSRYCQMLIDFFDIEPFVDIEIPHYNKFGALDAKGNPIVTWVDKQRVANRTPTLRGFVKKIGVCISTVYNWLDEKHPSFKPRFLDAFARARELRKWFLIENGLHGTHNATYAKFVACNETDMKDTTKQEVTGEDGGPLELKIVDFSKVKIDELEDEQT